MGVDQVEVIALVDHARDRALGRLEQQGRRHIHADLGHYQIRWMRNLDTVAHLAAWHPGLARILPEARILRREPRRRRHHPRLDLAAGDQVAQPGFDKNAVARFFAIGEQRAEGQDLHQAAAPVKRP